MYTKAGNGSADAGAAGKVSERLPILQKEADHPCSGCAACCRYLAIEIETPATNTEYDYIVWYLYHTGVSVFVDWEGHWHVKFESRCQKLTPEGLCGVYEDRPAICRDFDWRDCEKHVPDEPPDKYLFETAEQFLDWLARRRPKAHQRFLDHRRERRRERTETVLARVRITELLPAPPQR